MSSQIIVVDKDDKIITYKKRGTLLSKDIYRVSALWITNKKGEVLLAKRAMDKKLYPGCWGPAVAGTVEKGETYKIIFTKKQRKSWG